MRLVELDTRTGTEHVWNLLAPPEDSDAVSANFHSAFYFEQNEKSYVGLLRTGGVLETLTTHDDPAEHAVIPMSPSTIWIV